MQIRLIRNATLKITMAGTTLLTDPVFSPKHGIESFAGIEKNPVVDLPCSVSEIMDDVHAVLVSHHHLDHFDPAAQAQLPFEIPIFCQPDDEKRIKGHGFTTVTSVDKTISFGALEIIRTFGAHALGEKWLKSLGPVSGFLITAPGEPSVYWAGDTVLTQEVRALISTEKPDIILTHSCGAMLEDSGPIVMDAAQTLEICNLAPWARVVAVHMEALDHATVSREQLSKAAKEAGITNLVIPEDGESLNFYQKKGDKG